MSEQPQGQGWWQAADGRWYPPQQWQPPPPGPASPPSAQQWEQPGPAPQPSSSQQWEHPQPGPEFPASPQQWQQPPGSQAPPPQWQAQPPGYQGPPPQWQPQGPGYAAPPQYGPPAGGRPPRKRNRGCLVAVIVGIVLVLAVAGIAAYFVDRALTAVKDVSGGGIGSFGQANCPAEQDVSSTVGSPVTLAVSGNVVVASGCSYLATDRTAGADVQITVGLALAADDQFTQLASDAATQGTSPAPISVGDRGEAFGGQGRSDAIAVTGDSMILVEIFNAGDTDIGDKKAAAVALLEKVIAAR